MNILDKLEKEQMRDDIPDFGIGDTLSVHLKISEEGRERIQVFTGILIARRGTGVRENITLRRVAHGQGVEKVFILHSPRIDRIERGRRGSVRRAKLYYLRDKKGKRARVKELK